MALSRLRLRLAGWFALAFLAGLLLMNLGLFVYLHHQSDQRFNRALAAEAGELLGAIRLEYAEAPRYGLREAVDSALEEWVPRPEAFAVYDDDGNRLAMVGPITLARVLPPRLPPSWMTPVDVPRRGEHGARLIAVQAVTPAVTVVVASSTERLDEDAEAFALWFVLSAPLTALLSLAAGYVLSRRALRPVRRLELAIGAIAPDALEYRLPVPDRPDELDRVALQFNALLERLERAQARNRRFIEETAHQIRTPLTLVLGETELALDRPRSVEAQRDVLRRVRLAAIQMRRRVEELVLLARAEAGERVPLVDSVELDGLVLECADLMRGRAQALGRRLELARMDPVVVRGSDALLREALIELLENACRHGTGAVPVRLAVVDEGRTAVVEIVNAVDADTTAPDIAHADSRERQAPAGGGGLGLPVVRWIAAEHGGELQQWREGARFIARLRVPAGPAS